MGFTDKLRGIKKEDYDKANAQAGSFLGGKDGQTGTDVAQEKYKQYQAGKAGNTTATGSSSQTATTDVGTTSTGQQQQQQQHHGPTPTGEHIGQETSGDQRTNSEYNAGTTAVAGSDSSQANANTTTTATSSSSPSTHGQKHGESTKHPGLLAKFETGVHHLDAKIAKLPEHLQKEAHKSFQKGYEDAKKAFKHQK